jgi:ectoine hydroxylase-related dioxygenase (phytanoyl-CoA dioxygenase family)
VDNQFCRGVLVGELLAESILRVLGQSAGLVRGLYFDKPAGSTWALPWHRDLTIAVKRHGLMGRFCKPTRKAGVPHVEAPADILAAMLTARIHLDDMKEDNGPLRIIPGSHMGGTAPPTGNEFGVNLHCAAGDVMLMRPLLLHASCPCPADFAGHRRIVHLEWAAESKLPDDYSWHTFIPLEKMRLEPQGR